VAGKVFAEAGNGKSGSKSQKGRWRGLDEDISDDQVWVTIVSDFKLKCERPFQAISGFLFQ
jgi:hypothetical protein